MLENEITTVDKGAEKSDDLISLVHPYAQRLTESADPEVVLLFRNKLNNGWPDMVHGTITSHNETDCGIFFKLSRTPEYNRQLKRESIGATIASKLGIPIPAVISPYQDLQNEYGLLCMQMLDPHTWETVKGGWMGLSETNPAFGDAAGELIQSASGKELPDDVDTSNLLHNWRYGTGEAFQQGWTEVLKIAKNVARTAISSDAETSLTAHVYQIEKELMPYISQSEKDRGKKYFVHGDMTPYNMAFSTTDSSALLLDFEYAGVSENQFLAQLADLSNFFGRCWANPEMQFNALRRFRELSDPADKETTDTLERAAIVLGTLFFADAAEDPNDPRYFMGQSLVRNIDKNMARLETELTH